MKNSKETKAMILKVLSPDQKELASHREDLDDVCVTAKVIFQFY